MARNRKSASDTIKEGAAKFGLDPDTFEDSATNASETVTVDQLDASVDAPIPTEPAPTENGRRKKDTSNPPVYAFTAVSDNASVKSLYKEFPTIGQFKKWWDGSKELVRAVYQNGWLVRIKRVADNLDAVDILTTATEPTATTDQPVQ